MSMSDHQRPPSGSHVLDIIFAKNTDIRENYPINAPNSELLDGKESPSKLVARMIYKIATSTPSRSRPDGYGVRNVDKVTPTAFDLQ